MAVLRKTTVNQTRPVAPPAGTELVRLIRSPVADGVSFAQTTLDVVAGSKTGSDVFRLADVSGLIRVAYHDRRIARGTCWAALSVSSHRHCVQLSRIFSPVCPHPFLHQSVCVFMSSSLFEWRAATVGWLMEHDDVIVFRAQLGRLLLPAS